MNKINKRWLLVWMWMGVIFFLSSQTGEASAKSSMLVGQAVERIIYGVVDTMAQMPGQDVRFMDLIPVIRKLGHLMEYLVLGVLLMWAFYYDRKPRGSKAVLSFIIGAAYACTDEFHQWFVPGRGAEISDVLIDSIGVLLGVLLVAVLVQMKNWVKYLNFLN